MVSVRSASIAKRMQELPVRKYSSSPKKVELTGVRIPAGFNVELGNGVAVIAGGNGAGKSSLLQAIRACLDSSVTVMSDSVGWFSGITAIEVQWADDRRGSATHSSKLELARDADGRALLTRTGAAPSNIYYVDAAFETGQILDMLRDDPNYLDLIEGVDPAPVSADALTLASYVLGRPYDEVDIYEITSVSADDAVMPYFNVSALGAEYSVLAMGRGELSAIYLLWRLEQFPPGSVVILEEPETHLAALSQRKLAEALTLLSVKSDLSIILSTHSPGVFDSLPAGQVALVSSLPNMSVSSGLDSKTLARNLGLKPAVRGLAITEDRFAAQMLEMIISSLDIGLLDEIGISYAKNGESGVRAIVSGLTAYRKSGLVNPTHTVVGVLDGDQLGMNNGPGSFGFLPGNVAPELVVHKRLMAWYSGQEEYAEFPSDTATKLREALDASHGLDHHDWLISVASTFGGSSVLLEVIGKFLFQDEDFAAEAEKLRSFLRLI